MKKFLLTFGLQLIFCFSDLHAGVLIGSYNFDSDADLEKLYNDGSSIRIEEPNGGSQSCNIGNSTWNFVRGGICDLDGISGLEITINTGSILKIIKYSGNSITTTNYGVSAPWSILGEGFAELDGVTGNEIIINKGQNILVITHKSQTTKEYGVNASQWNILGKGFSELDGVSGNEIVINKGQNILVITHKSQTTKEYGVNASQWSILGKGYSDLDGVTGSEIIINKGQNILVITHKSQSTKGYNVNASQWSIFGKGFANTDGVSGNEIVINRGNNIYIIRHKNNTTNTFSVGNSTWNAVGLGDTDGLSGDEIVINDGYSVKVFKDTNNNLKTYQNIGTKKVGVNNVDNTPELEIIVGDGSNAKVISDKTGNIQTYNITGSNWSVVGVDDTDGNIGEELVFWLVNTDKIRVIRPANNTSSTYNLGTAIINDFESFSDLDGISGCEVAVKVDYGGNRKVVCDKNSVIRNYNTSTTWGSLGVQNIDTAAGNELLYLSGTQVKGIKDSNNLIIENLK